MLDVKISTLRKILLYLNSISVRPTKYKESCRDKKQLLTSHARQSLLATCNRALHSALSFTPLGRWFLLATPVPALICCAFSWESLPLSADLSLSTFRNLLKGHLLWEGFPDCQSLNESLSTVLLIHIGYFSYASCLSVTNFGVILLFFLVI